MEQKLPRNLDEKELKKYANTFFGFGSWKSDYWLIGLEERGAECKSEFCKRYTAWKKTRLKAMVDLKRFFDKCHIEQTPDWNNTTWRKLHCLCRMTGFDIGKLSGCNNRWGGAHKVKRDSFHVALIEASPFPARSSKDWPYKKWKYACMETRQKYKDEFEDGRWNILKGKLKKYKPKVVIDYSGAFLKKPDFKLKHVVLKSSNRFKFHWNKINNGETLFVRINHPSYMSLKVLVELSDEILKKFPKSRLVKNH